MSAVTLVGSYNYALVALSVLIAMFASYAALDLAGRVTVAGGRIRAVWLLGGAAAMGTGIWSMHYIGMLAFILPIPVAYHWPTVLLSLLAAILASVIALYVVSRPKMGASRAIAGSILMGAGIASMHYIGMAAMRLPVICRFNVSLVVLSVVFAVLISFAALWITFHFRDEKTGIGREKLAGAVVMGAAIPVMHYTGMAAASFTPSDTRVDLSHAVSISTLGTAGIAAVTFVVIGLALLTSWVDRRFAAHALELEEEKLRRSETYLAEAQRLSKTGSFGWKPSAREITWSEETFRIFQYDQSTSPTVELILQRVHPEDAIPVQQIIERAIQEGKDFDFEHRLLMPDGSVKHLHVVAHALNDEAGSIEFVGAVMDVTDRKRSEEALLRSETYLAEGQKLSHTGSWAFNPQDPVYWSEENFRIWGFDPQQGLPDRETILKRIHPEDRTRMLESAQKALREKADYLVEFRIVLPDGTVKHIRGIGHPVFSPAGELVEVVGTNVDATERKRAEEERERFRQTESDLARISRASTMGELTASLAHEVNQPIAAAVTDARTCLRWLERGQPDLEEAREAAARVVKDATRAAEIISRTRLLFKKGAPQWELVNVNEIIRDIVGLTQSEITRHAITLRTELAEDIPPITGDRVQLQQVMMNLILNSIDAMKDGCETRELVIGSQQVEDGQLMVLVRDTGVGLPPKQADQIFNAFFTTKTHGTGMGLRISRSIVETHGGRLWAANNSSRGASFFLTLPTRIEAVA